MWSRVSLWVMQQDAAYRIDARDGWVFHLVDATGADFAWKGIDYSAGIVAGAPAYLDYEVPPGTYVVWAARGSGTEAEDTHRAVLAVHDEPHLVVRLLPRPRVKPCPDDEPEHDDTCRLEISSVRGDKVREDRPGRVVVQGEAHGCSRVVVEVSSDGGSMTETVDVEQDGSWTAVFRSDGELRCGAVVVVTVTCVDDKRCRTRRELPVDCARASRKQSPRSQSGPATKG